MATTVSRSTTIPESAIEQLAAQMSAPLLRPGDPGYDQARTVYNAMIDRRPAIIARCADVADVIAAVNFARENNVLLAVRGGGHNGPGLGVCDDGLVIDLSLM
jgi:FAD/FMN-containing dehydrogenase